MAVSFKPVRPLFQTGTSSASRWLSYVGLGIGVLLLLCSVQMFVNIQSILGQSSIRKTGYDYISITKTVTNETMGQPEKNLFNNADIEDIRSKPFADAVAPLISNQFRVQLTGGNLLPFKTDIFLESVENEFIDTVPPAFKWSEGDQYVPIIVSSDFLEAWNIFAPAQDLPQVSEQTASNIPIQVSIMGNGRETVFNGSIVAFSDRINSALVPKTFIDWANKNFGEQQANGFTRLYIKTKDANDPELIAYLDKHNFKVNRDKIKFGRAKQTFQGIFTGLGVFGLLVVAMALMLFSFYLQLVIARSKDSIQLLLLLGYSPAWLGRNVSKQFIPVYIFIVLISLLLTQLMQWAFHTYVMYSRPELSTPINWSVAALALLLIGLSIFTNNRMVKNQIYRLY